MPQGQKGFSNPFSAMVQNEPFQSKNHTGYVWKHSLHRCMFPQGALEMLDDETNPAQPVHNDDIYVMYHVARAEYCKFYRKIGTVENTFEPTYTYYDGKRYFYVDPDLWESTKRWPGDARFIGNPKIWYDRPDPDVIPVAIPAKQVAATIGEDIFENLECEIRRTPTRGYTKAWVKQGPFGAFLRINGWPIQIREIGTYGDEYRPDEILGVQFGGVWFDDNVLFDLIRADGLEYWVEFWDFGNKFLVPDGKARMFFTPIETYVEEETGDRVTRVMLSKDRGNIPCWLAVPQLQLFAGGVPLGHIKEVASADMSLQVQHFPEAREILESGDIHGPVIGLGPIPKKVYWNYMGKTRIFSDPRNYEEEDTMNFAEILKKCLQGKMSQITTVSVK